MTQNDRTPRRFGIHASVIQLLALLSTGAIIDRHITEGALTLASLLFWACSASLLWWRDGRPSVVDLFFLRWGLLPFALIGTPLLRPIAEQFEPLLFLLYPGEAALVVVPLMYMFARIFLLRAPVDGTPPASDECAGK
jgi:hypothetical protein